MRTHRQEAEADMALNDGPPSETRMKMRMTYAVSADAQPHLILLLLLSAAAATAEVSRPSSTKTSAALPAATCGVERWPIKTLADPVGRTAHFTLRNSSVHALRWLHTPTIAARARSSSSSWP